MLLWPVLLILFTMSVAFRSTRSIRRVVGTRRNLFGSPSDDKKGLMGGLADKMGMGGMGNMMGALKKAQEMSKAAEKMKTDLTNQQISFSDPSGGATVTFTGMADVINIKVTDALAAKGGAAVSAALNQALREGTIKTKGSMQEQMKAILPPGMDFPKF